jgi:outer membrane lipoprotein-sorting protein
VYNDYVLDLSRYARRRAAIISAETEEVSMSRCLLVTVLCVPAILLTPARAQEADLTIDQIVQKHTEALGGAEKLKAIQTLTVTGKASLMGGQIEAPVTMKVKRPAQMRMELAVQGQSFVQAFDGTTAWVINPFMGAPDPQKSDEEDTRSARDDADFIEGSLVDYKAKGNQIELMGKEDVGGSAAYKIKVIKKGGTVEYEFVDTKTFLPVKSTGKRKQMGQEMDYVSTPSNYKAVNGVMIPYSLSQMANGNPAMDLTIEKIEVNTPIDDSVFRMPEKPKEEKAKEPPK